MIHDDWSSMKGNTFLDTRTSTRTRGEQKKPPKQRKRKEGQMHPTKGPMEKGHRMTMSTQEAPHVIATEMDTAVNTTIGQAIENLVHIAVSKLTGKRIEQISSTQQIVVSTNEKMGNQKNPTLHPEWIESKSFSRRAQKEALETAVIAMND